MLVRYFIITLFMYLPLRGIAKPYLDKNHWKKGEIILNYKAGTEWKRLEDIVKRLDTEIVYRSQFANFVTVRFDEKRDIWELIERFESFPEILFAEPNGIARISWTPNDPYFYLQWNFGEDHLNMPLAWNIEHGGDSTVIVSILDTGIAYQTNQIPSYELDEVESGDGYYHISPDLTETHFVEGYDFVNQDTLPNDENGHGTHICGTVAQSTNNAKGVAGMAFNVSIMPVRVLDECGSGTCDMIADGIYFSYQNGADILSMSLGGAPGDSTGFGTIHQAIIAATNAGAIVVAAAGNAGEGQLSYPAGFEECIAVGATDIDTNLAPYSQWGEGIDVVAPGGDYNDTIPGTGYVAAILQSTYYQLNYGSQKATVDSFCYMFLQGTSMATPHVSALAALLISHGITNPSDIKQAIYSTCIDLGAPGYDTVFGYGIIYPPACLAIGIEEPNEIVSHQKLRILQNPIRGDYIELEISLVQRTNAVLCLFNLLGQKVKDFSLNGLSSRKQKLKLEIKGLTSGVYFLRFEKGQNIESQKITIIE
ncbi:MAG: T9SS type A sorting domain-containing protein [Candidatus Cloacimonadota bacterium]|nr:MAG: T9SS type A sorting domain-containing protein [Candidatus Cloacimonadota bacterium]